MSWQMAGPVFPEGGYPTYAWSFPGELNNPPLPINFSENKYFVLTGAGSGDLKMIGRADGDHVGQKFYGVYEIEGISVPFYCYPPETNGEFYLLAGSGNHIPNPWVGLETGVKSCVVYLGLTPPPRECEQHNGFYLRCIYDQLVADASLEVIENTDWKIWDFIAGSGSELIGYPTEANPSGEFNAIGPAIHNFSFPDGHLPAVRAIQLVNVGVADDSFCAIQIRLEGTTTSRVISSSDQVGTLEYDPPINIGGGLAGSRCQAEVIMQWTGKPAECEGEFPGEPGLPEVPFPVDPPEDPYVPPVVPVPPDDPIEPPPPPDDPDPIDPGEQPEEPVKPDPVEPVAPPLDDEDCVCHDEFVFIAEAIRAGLDSVRNILAGIWDKINFHAQALLFSSNRSDSKNRENVVYLCESFRTMFSESDQSRREDIEGLKLQVKNSAQAILDEMEKQTEKLEEIRHELEIGSELIAGADQVTVEVLEQRGGRVEIF